MQEEKGSKGQPERECGSKWRKIRDKEKLKTHKWSKEMVKF
jgi:hypothetical protein